MSRNTILGLVVLTLVLAGGYFYRNSNAPVTRELSAPDTFTKAETTTSSNQYLPFTREAFESAKTSRRVLFFYASWCPTCIPANTDFQQNTSLLPIDLTVIRVNYNDPETDDDEKALANRYGITYQHTYVQVDAEGNEVAKWNGGSVKELLAKIK